MIRGESTNLRAVERADAGLLHRLLNAPDAPRTCTLPDVTVSLAEVQRMVEGWLEREAASGLPACLLIETLAGEPAGALILTGYEETHRAVELAMLIDGGRDATLTHATDALSAATDALFAHWNVHRIGSRSEAGEKSLNRVYERTGFQRDAILRQALYRDGSYHDVYAYSLLATDRPETSTGG